MTPGGQFMHQTNVMFLLLTVKWPAVMLLPWEVLIPWLENAGLMISKYCDIVLGKSNIGTYVKKLKSFKNEKKYTILV